MSLISELAAIAHQAREGCALLMDDFVPHTPDELANASIAELNAHYENTLHYVTALSDLDDQTKGILKTFLDEISADLIGAAKRIQQAQADIKTEVLAHYRHRAQELPDIGPDKRTLIPLGGFQVRNNIKVVVQDRSLVPDCYKKIDLPAIKKALQKEMVPGTAYTVEPSVAYRPEQE